MNKQIYEEASEWLVELHAGDVDAAGQERLDAWFRESPHHIRAFLELSSIWEDGADSDLDRSKSTGSLLAIARSSTNVIPLDRMQPELDQITQQEAVEAARFLAGVVGKAHARQMDSKTRKLWLTRLKGHRGKTLDAPSWLWTSVVELVAAHEAAYLEHCRRFALAANNA